MCTLKGSRIVCMVYFNEETKTNNIVALENKLMIMKSQSGEGKLTVEMAETQFSDVPMLMELVR